ncbi:chromate transporter [Fumia xinanensis]|uniref:Chromate transporter n=1 Tax=Fumia xinanensis TaxID=2763659 RepID=A0A926E3D0_9FIRM|nr:chromate transporter [Fumia xinanensis]MBC8558813.1 chromate transporter [Fumia xinanensis]
MILKKDLKFYWKLFSSTFTLSAFTFGGGFVIIPLMRKKFVEEYHWIEEDEMLDMTAIAQSSPGAIAVNASIIIGYRLAGVLGALVTILGTVLPPLIILTAISYFYAAFRDNLTVQALMRGMQAGVAAVIIDVVYTMGRSIIKEKNILPILVMITAFAAVYFFNVNVMIIIFAAGVIGCGTIYLQTSQGKKGPAK